MERLLSDLVLTTESYEKASQRVNDLEQEAALAGSQLYPLRRENTRLVRENNQVRAWAGRRGSTRGVRCLRALISPRSSYTWR